VIDEDLVDREVEYAKGKVWDAPQNQSPWSYLGGVMKHADRRQSEERAFAEQFVDFEEGGKGVRSSFALEWLAECARESGDVELGRKALGALRDTYDPIRKGYWEWRMTELEGEGMDDGKGAGEGVSKAGGPVLRPKRPGESGHGPVVRV
jgi:protein farnesyltransferase/geranylgeranyltransferase type-1 subunit alpha